MKLCTSQLMYLSHYLPPKKVYLKPDDNLLLLLVDCVCHYGINNLLLSCISILPKYKKKEAELGSRFAHKRSIVFCISESKH